MKFNVKLEGFIDTKKYSYSITVNKLINNSYNDALKDVADNTKQVMRNKISSSFSKARPTFKNVFTYKIYAKNKAKPNLALFYSRARQLAYFQKNSNIPGKTFVPFEQDNGKRINSKNLKKRLTKLKAEGAMFKNDKSNIIFMKVTKANRYIARNYQSKVLDNTRLKSFTRKTKKGVKSGHTILEDTVIPIGHLVNNRKLPKRLEFNRIIEDNAHKKVVKVFSSKFDKHSKNLK